MGDISSHVLPYWAARTLAERTAGGPGGGHRRGWASWAPDARPLWTGTGEDLLTGLLPPHASVVKLWWD